MTKCVDTCHKLTFNLRVLEGMGLCQDILILLQIYQLNQNQDNSSQLSTGLQVEYHLFKSSLVVDISDCAYKIKTKGNIESSQKTLFLFQLFRDFK